MMTRSQLYMAEKPSTKEDQLVIVGPGADEDDAPAEPVNEGAGEDYAYPEGDDADEPAGRHADADERTGHSEEDAEGEGQPLTREQKRRRKKREKHERDQRELALLRTRNEQLERAYSQRIAAVESRQTQSDVLQIDSRISQAESDVREAESLLQQSLQAGDTGAAVEALRVRDQLRDGLQQLRGTKQHTLQTAQARHQATTQPVADPVIANRAAAWSREHAWFDPAGRDEDSAIAKAVEARLFNEGRLHPGTDEYWEEGDRRLAKLLPERYGNVRGREEDTDEAPRPARRVNGNGNGTRRASGPTIKVGGRERTLRKGEVYIDEDRKQAMIEAGVWEDPKERERFM